MLKSASDGEIIYMGFLMDVAAPIIVPSGQAPVLPPSRRRDLMHQMIWLVQRLHAKRIVHGDLKLENMLLDDQGNLRLCDFAEGRYVDEDERVWEGMSTWHYGSPIWPTTRSNLAGIVYVVSRMDWYCALSEHLLNEDHIDKAGSIQRELVNRTEQIEDLLKVINQDIREFIDLQKKIERDKEDVACLRDLFVVDPQDDMKNIERKKDDLLDEAYKWILNTREYAAFTNWYDDDSSLPSCRLLWIKGHAGTGKTMLLMRIIRELSSKLAKLAPCVSHFFCQGMNDALNSATATLRSLIWLLLVQQPHLISHLRPKHSNAGPSLFQGDSAFISLSTTFESMLKDPNLSPVYFIVDALDECKQDLTELIQLLTNSLKITKKVKWLVSNRPIVELNTSCTTSSLVELDTQKLEQPVNIYIDKKLSTFSNELGYTKQALDNISAEIRERAGNTFLWLLLNGRDALKAVKKFPPGLSKVYGCILDMIDGGGDGDPQVGYPQYCKNVLAVTTLVARPLTLSELAETVYLIHQSAKDYLDENYTSRLQPAGVTQGHTDISIRSIDVMSLILKQNMYNLDFGFDAKDISPPDPDPLAPIRYSCVFWANHLLKGESHGHKEALADDGTIHGSILERSPVQIYGSALVFNPSIGEVRRTQWKERLPFIETIAGVRDHWDAYRQTLEGHGDSVDTTAFSEDNKYLDTNNGSVRLPWPRSTFSPSRY
ncbi:NACHT domain-containing protein [Corynascus similis CBS 632.67]